MKKSINLSTQHNSIITNIEIDNSSEFKDFSACNLDKENVKNKIHCMLSTIDREITLDINGTVLRGSEVMFFREFIMQTPNEIEER